MTWPGANDLITHVSRVGGVVAEEIGGIWTQENPDRVSHFRERKLVFRLLASCHAPRFRSRQGLERTCCRKVNPHGIQSPRPGLGGGCRRRQSQRVPEHSKPSLVPDIMYTEDGRRRWRWRSLTDRASSSQRTRTPGHSTGTRCLAAAGRAAHGRRADRRADVRHHASRRHAGPFIGCGPRHRYTVLLGSAAAGRQPRTRSRVDDRRQRGGRYRPRRRRRTSGSSVPSSRHSGASEAIHG